MEKTIYWAVLLEKEHSKALQAIFQPAHPNIYAEHTTIVFQPDEEQDVKWMKRLGERVELLIVGHAKDDKGDAVVVEGIEREGGGIPHITLSCADKTKPFYSNALLAKGFTKTLPVRVVGIIARYTSQGWITK